MNPQPALQVPATAWAIFAVCVSTVLALDLYVAGRRPHKIGLKESLVWSAGWIALALAFGLGILFWQGAPWASKFASGYVLELSLSVDNLFVFIIIFAHYKVPEAYHHKVLFWGILGAVLLRAVFIGLGAAMVAKFHWLLYGFGAFLLYTGLKLAFHKEHDVSPQRSPLIRFIHSLVRVTPGYQGASFFVRRKGLLWATPLLVVVLVVEATDLIFAVDSIPAVFGVTTDPFIVYTSNIFAILGLRSMFFALEGVIHMFRYLKTGLAVILSLIGLKLLFLEALERRLGFEAGEYWVLGLIALVLGGSVIASLLNPAPKAKKKGARRRAAAARA